MFTVTTHFQRLQRLAAAVSLVVAAVYALIATDVITVLEDQATESPGPPLVAAGAFAILGLLLLVSARRVVLLSGVAIQVVSIVMYLLVGAERVPAFEAWGIGLKVVQLLLLAVFVGLLRSRNRNRDAAPTARRSDERPRERLHAAEGR